MFLVLVLLKAKAFFSELSESQAGFTCLWRHPLTLHLETVVCFHRGASDLSHLSQLSGGDYLVVQSTISVTKHKMTTVILTALRLAAAFFFCCLSLAVELERIGANTLYSFNMVWP